MDARKQGNREIRRRAPILLLAAVLGLVVAPSSARAATNVAGNCPVGGFTVAGSPWNFTGSVSVPAGTTCTVQAGATLNGNGQALSVAGTATFNAIGASTANRNVTLNNLTVSFQSTSLGTIQFATVTSSTVSYPILAQGAQTIDSSTITLTGGSYAFYVAGGSPTISNNTVTASTYGVYVQAGTPTISGNSFTVSYAGIHFAAGNGTASGNTIGFSGGNPPRYGVNATGATAPTISGNTILDAGGSSDIGVSATGTAAGVQIVNNTIQASGGDTPLELSPALFQPGSQVSGNVFPTGLAAGVEITGNVQGTATIGPLIPAAATTVTSFVVHNLTVPASSTLQIAAGIGVRSVGTTGAISVSGAFSAVGAGNADRNVTFDNVSVVHQPGSTGTLQFCTFTSSLLSYPILLNGAQTVDRCTITLTGGTYGIYVAGGAPTISNNTIAAEYGVYVQGGSPSISGNAITVGYAGIYFSTGNGTASGNTIGFSGNTATRYGIYVSTNSAPTLSGNTILDDIAHNDIAISVQSQIAGVQIVGNTIFASAGDSVEISPALFQAGSQVNGNTFPTGLAAGIEITGTAQGMATIAPLTPAVGTTVSTFIVHNLAVAASADLAIAPGVTITGGNTNGSISVSGSLTAIGAGDGNRNIVFDDVSVVFQPSGTGTLQFCTMQSDTVSYPLLLNGEQTVDHCTITLNGGSYGIYVAGGSPTISNNAISATYDVYVQNGSPSISNNSLTTSYIAVYFTNGGGSASGNTVAFSASSPPRYAFYTSGAAVPSFSGNNILDDTGAADIAFAIHGSNAGVEIVNNTIGTSGNDIPLQLSPAIFQAPSQLSGNTFPTGLAAGIELVGTAQGMVIIGPLTPAPATTVTSYVLHNLTVPASATLQIAAGITLSGGNSSGSISVSGAIQAIGAGNANRNITFDDITISFQPNGTGTIQFCTFLSAAVSYPLLLQGPSQTVDRCTITLAGGSYGVYVAGSTPTISNNAITATYGVYVQGGNPSISGNAFSISYIGLYFSGGSGTASGNTIGFSGGSPGRYGVYVAASSPIVDGNTIYDDAARTDTGIHVQAGPGNPATQIVNNMICTSGADTFISVPGGFTGTVSGNLNQCGAPTSTPTVTTVPTNTITPTTTRTRTATTGLTATTTRTPTLTSPPTASGTATRTATISPTVPATNSATPTSTSTRTPAASPSGTSTRTATSTATSTNTSTRTPGATETGTLPATRTPTASSTAAIATSTATSAPTGTATAAATGTAPPPTRTSTPISMPPSVTATVPAPTSTATAVATATPSPTATSTAGDSFPFSSEVLGPAPAGSTGNRGRYGIPNLRVDLFDCASAGYCLYHALTPRLTTFTDENGEFTFDIPFDVVPRKRYVQIRAVLGPVDCRLLLTPSDLRLLSQRGSGGSAAQATELIVDPIAEALSRLLLDAGADSFSDESIASLRSAVDAANADSNFAGLTVGGANDLAEVTAANDEGVQAIVEDDLRTPTPIPCVGDCDTDERVTVEEIVRGVAIRGASVAFEQCPRFDADASLALTESEVKDAVRRALGGCL